MKQFYQITLVAEDGAKNIEFYGSLYQAEKVFFALSFALVQSEYTDVLLFAGESQLYETRLRK